MPHGPHHRLRPVPDAGGGRPPAQNAAGRTPLMGASGPDDLARAYHQALYRIDAATPIVLRIGATHPELKALAATLGQPEWGTFLSASNPHSRILRPAAN